MSEGRDGGAPVGGGAAFTAGTEPNPKVSGSRDVVGGEERDKDSGGGRGGGGGVMRVPSDKQEHGSSLQGSAVKAVCWANTRRPCSARCIAAAAAAAG